MSDFLARIVERTRARIPLEPPDRVLAQRVAGGRTPFAFSSALKREGVNVIAEIKSASPSAGSIVSNPDVESIAADYARGGAAAISIVTEPDFFLGSRDWIARAKTTGLPVIMKDFVVEPSQLMNGIAAGADAILLRAPILAGLASRSSSVFSTRTAATRWSRYTTSRNWIAPSTAVRASSASTTAT